MNFTDQQVDLTNCDKEPIHIPGHIQSHGCLLACDASLRTVVRHSANAPEMLGITGEVNGTLLEAILGEVATHDLRNAIAVVGRGNRPALMPGTRLPSGQTFDIAVHNHKSIAIVEFEPSKDIQQPIHTTQVMIDRIRHADSVESLINRTSRLIKGVLGYDRVMIYRFENDGSGKVVAESKQSDLESFLGQYFPASDIPQQARALYLKNTLRIISDASGVRVPIIPALDASSEPLDLSFSHLRSVSPIHCEYLRNMGVAASMSISIIVEGTLWGLIACHHYSPRVLPMSARIAAEMFGEFFSLNLQALKQSRKLDTANQAHAALDSFLKVAAHHTNIEELLSESFKDFAQLMPCDGVGLWMNKKWYSNGVTPPDADIPRLASFVGSVSDGRIWAAHGLSQYLPEAESYSSEASGLLAIPLSKVQNNYLMFFRKELVQTLDWAGNPEKSYETGPLGDRLTPRKSFAIWKEIVNQQAQPWTEADREVAEAARVALVEVALHHSELMADEREQAEVRQRMLNEELNHRVKNVLAIIKSLVGNPKQDGRSLAEYVTALKGRIQALSFAHDQVIRGDGGGSLRELLEAEMTPYRSAPSHIQLSGPTIMMDSRAFSVMALVLHELATNAAKYGALAETGGNLMVDWNLDESGNCVIVWREIISTRLQPPGRTGFGTALISRSIPYDLGGKSEISYLVDGVEACLLLPARNISSVASDLVENDQNPKHPSTTSFRQSKPLRVFLVEDQMLIAMDVESMLEDNGITGIETATSSAMALERLKSFTPDVAILDINLGADSSIPVAWELRKREIPFLFATGYADTVMVPPELSGVPLIRKPYDEHALLEAIGQLVGTPQDA